MKPVIRMINKPNGFISIETYDLSKLSRIADMVLEQSGRGIGFLLMPILRSRRCNA